MPFKPPSFDDMILFTAQTHQLEKLPCNFQDVTNTYTKKTLNYYADGHLRAISYAMTKLLDKNEFPARDPNTLSSRYKSEAALFWVRELHSIMCTPLLKDHTEQAKPDGMKSNLIGVWRNVPANNFLGQAPAPQLIPGLMNNWLKELCTIHQSVKDRLDNPYGIKKEEFRVMNDFAEEQPYFFSTVQPFQHGCNRFGRLMENVIRMAWRMKFKANVLYEAENFKERLEPYLQEELPKKISAARNLRNF